MKWRDLERMIKTNKCRKNLYSRRPSAQEIINQSGKQDIAPVKVNGNKYIRRSVKYITTK